MLTINEIAVKFGVDVKAATGFVHFVNALKAVKRGSAPSNGNKGKPPFTYGWAEGGVDMVVGALLKLPEASLTVEAPAATPVTPEAPSQAITETAPAPQPALAEGTQTASVADLMAAVANDAPQADATTAS